MNWKSIPLYLLVLALLQALLVPKYMETNPEGALTGEYYRNAGQNDVLFIGDCEVYENFSPITLWEEYGIPSYIRGSPQQTIWQSYYLLEDAFRYETPKVVVYSVLAMKYDTVESTGSQSRREAYNRLTLDTMRWSPSKWKAILASMTGEERQWEGLATYLFPILRYHERWSQLTGEDLRWWLRREGVSDNGYLMQTAVRPLTDAHVEPPLADYALGENSWYWLDRIRQLCEQQGSQLVLLKSPAMYPIWWWEWDRQVRQYAEQYGLLYFNMTEYPQETGIDWTLDTFDAGLHLNVTGAEKASRWLGAALQSSCGLPDRRQDGALADAWQEKCEIYHARKAALQ